MAQYWQQGDVLIKQLPEDKSQRRSWGLRNVEDRKTKEVEELTVAYGEATGHSHKIVGRIKNYVPEYASEEIVFELLEEATIYHEEHGEITLPPGKYFIEQVQEFDHFRGEVRRVVD
jgi:uncharacterized lipoprotein YehR (DUF1307 family)